MVNKSKRSLKSKYSRKSKARKSLKKQRGGRLNDAEFTALYTIINKMDENKRTTPQEEIDHIVIQLKKCDVGQTRALASIVFYKREPIPILINNILSVGFARETYTEGATYHPNN